MLTFVNPALSPLTSPLLSVVWLRRDPYERLPIQVLGGNKDKVAAYLFHVGLGFVAPDAKNASQLLLVKSAFYQGE